MTRLGRRRDCSCPVPSSVSHSGLPSARVRCTAYPNPCQKASTLVSLEGTAWGRRRAIEQGDHLGLQRRLQHAPTDSAAIAWDREPR